jgi:hypothetical protein
VTAADYPPWPGTPAGAWRLAEYRAAHPEAVIGDGGFGTWHARIPEPSGETVVNAHTLGELLDKLDKLDGEVPDTG